MVGYVYVLTNDAMPGLVKIGRSEDVKTRIDKLSSHTGVPVRFTRKFCCEVQNCEEVETVLHNALKPYRINPDREFFKIDPEQAIWNLLRLAAEQGDLICQVNLGLMYANGQGVPEDTVEAVRWHLAAAISALSGWKMSPDEKEAVRWYREAAEKGYPLGQSNLGTMFRDGRGVTQNDSEAVYWFYRAAQQGNPNGQANLGFMYQTGRGVELNRDEAIKWYRRAAEQGLQYAKDCLKRLGEA